MPKNRKIFVRALLLLPVSIALAMRLHGVSNYFHNKGVGIYAIVLCIIRLPIKAGVFNFK